MAGTRVLAHPLYGVGTLDAWAFAAAVGVLGTTALAATWIPARRATAVNPVTALRQE